MRTGSRHPGDLVTSRLETLHDTRRVWGLQLEYHGAMAGSPIWIGEDTEYVHLKVLDFACYLGQNPPLFGARTSIRQPGSGNPASVTRARITSEDVTIP